VTLNGGGAKPACFICQYEVPLPVWNVLRQDTGDRQPRRPSALSSFFHGGECAATISGVLRGSQGRHPRECALDALSNTTCSISDAVLAQENSAARNGPSWRNLRVSSASFIIA
jgi:hypothetical protein